MTENIAAENTVETIIYEKEVDSLGRSYATGKRKDSVARVWIKSGSGKFTVNGKDEKSYFGREILCNIINHPFEAVDQVKKFDVVATITGGGLSGQAGALAHGISKAIALFDPELRPKLRSEGFLTRDSRVVERKKYGRKKARKGKTYRKR